jgi:hypothetical protein
MAKLHTCEVDDVCGNAHVLREKALPELMGAIGPHWPIRIDGRRGSLAGEGSEIFFIPAS